MAHPKPKLNPSVKLLIRTARVVSPEKAADWFDDMHYELGFIDGLNEQLKFSFSTLGLALQLRFASISWSSPRVLTITGVGAAAVFAFFIFIPQTLQTPSVTLSEPSPIATESITLSDDAIANDTVEQAAGATLNTGEAIEADLDGEEDVFVAAQADRSVSAEAPAAATPVQTQNSSRLATSRSISEAALGASSESSAEKTSKILLLTSQQKEITLKALENISFTILTENGSERFDLAQGKTKDLTAPLELFIEDISTIELSTNTEQFDIPESKDANTIRIDISD